MAINQDVMFSSKSDLWETPQSFFDALDREFHFDLLHRGEIRFLRGRLKFCGAKYNAPFPSMLVIFRGVNGCGADMRGGDADGDKKD